MAVKERLDNHEQRVAKALGKEMPALSAARKCAEETLQEFTGSMRRGEPCEKPGARMTVP